MITEPALSRLGLLPAHWHHFFFALAVAGLLIPAGVFADEDPAESGTGSAEAFLQNEFREFAATYCFDCHSGATPEADIDFESYNSLEQLKNERPRWNQVRGLIEIGAMPPDDYDPRPTLEEREKIASWIDRVVNRVECEVVDDPGRVTVRRLNNTEYDNTIRDLLHVDFSPSQSVSFPSDAVGNGFDNQGDVLTLSPLQLEKYMQAAQLVSSRVIVQDLDSLKSQSVSSHPIFVEESTSKNFLFADGKYELKVRMDYGNQEGETVPVALLVDGEEVARWEVGRRKKTFKVDREMTAGEHTLTLHFVEDPHSPRKGDNERRIDFEFIGIEGPSNGEPALPPSHTRLIVSEPSEDKTVEQAATEIFKPFLRRAFRRPPTEADIQRVVNLVKMATDQGETFLTAVGFGLQSVLVSPNFLFRIENAVDEAGFESKPAQEMLSNYAVASRLSYFLWSSMPDEKLLELADAGRLQDPGVLRQQAARMLEDPKSQALISRFFGQLFGLDNLKDTDPAKDIFPMWNDYLRNAMRKEVELFCEEVVRNDLPLRTLLEGKFTYINPRLAELYGLDFEGQDPEELYRNGPGFPLRRRGDSREGAYRDENKWIRIASPQHRRGVLTQAAVLTLTSHPTETSPVKRGKWILENILGDPPPPAPPNVPSFEETKKQNEGLSLRQQLEIHRSNPSCASCHRIMDPLGLGFENFDAVGRWRERDGKHPIDAAGKLADGSTFTNALELVGLLAPREDDFARHITERLLTYALGRGLEPYDNCTVDEILKAARSQEYRLSALVEEIVVSEPFLKRRTIDPSANGRTASR